MQQEDIVYASIPLVVDQRRLVLCVCPRLTSRPHDNMDGQLPLIAMNASCSLARPIIRRMTLSRESPGAMVSASRSFLSDLLSVEC